MPDKLRPCEAEKSHRVDEREGDGTFVSLPKTLEWKQIQWSETNIRPW